MYNFVEHHMFTMIYTI